MKRLLLSLVAVMFLTQFVGCGDSSAPGGGTGVPDEVKKYEDRKKEEREGRAPIPK